MEILVLAMTKMISGICMAGFSTQQDPSTGLCWVRPVKEHGTLLLGDMTTEDGYVVRIGDVIELNLLRPRPNPPHVEDWVADFIRIRPILLRRLEGDKRANFFPNYLDQAPEEIMVHQTRSLCLIRPDDLSARFSLDPYSGKFDARIDMRMNGQEYKNLPVTGIKWRALGRSWLGEGGVLTISRDDLAARLAAEEFYLALGLGRKYQGKSWLLVIGVHVAPDYEVEIDYQRL
ncbi:MAG: hypothetical protein JXA42_07810 [Anaerolineales bacterium]|nr:hypothetical protein [Anaerolineales bacterium]